MARHRASWIGLSLDAWQMGIEAQQVIGLRLAKIAMGGAAGSQEATLMVSEKMQTAVAVQGDMAMALMNGTADGIPARTLATYRRKVAANRRRLLKDFS